jgi:hypothetical protein
MGKTMELKELKRIAFGTVYYEPSLQSPRQVLLPIQYWVLVRALFHLQQ